MNANAAITNNLLMIAHTAKNATMNTLRNELETLVHTVDANALDERRVLQAKRGCSLA